MSDKTYTLISDTTEEVVDVLDEAEFNQHLASPTILDALNKSKLALMNRPEGEVDWQRDERRDAYRAVEEAITKAEGTALTSRKSSAGSKAKNFNMRTETEQIKVLLARADHALREHDRYNQQASEMACMCILPFLRDTAKCRVEYGELDWHHVHILSEEAWAELLTLFRGYTKSRSTIPLDTQMSGACLEFKDNEVSLYMKTMTLGDHKIPVDVGPRLERFRKQREEFLKINAAQAEKFTNLPGAYIH